MEEKRVGYRAKCPKCGQDFVACKSIMQEWGMLENGHISCPGCKTFLNLTFNPNQEVMVATDWNEWLESKKEVKE